MSYHKEDWSLEIKTAQIDLTDALFNLTESVDGADNQEDLLVECEEIVKNFVEEAVQFTIDFTQKLLSLATGSILPPVAAPYEARAAVIGDQDKLNNELKDLVAETKRIDFTTDPEVAVSIVVEKNHEFGCEVKDSKKLNTVRHRLGDQDFITFEEMFSLSSAHKMELLTNLSCSRSQLSTLQVKLISGNLRELSAEDMFGYIGSGYIGSGYTGPHLVIVDIVKPFVLVTVSDVSAPMLKSVAMVSVAATHGDHTDRTGIGGECRIAYTEDPSNYYPVVVSSTKNVFHYAHLQVS